MFRSRCIRVDKKNRSYYSTKLYYDDEQLEHNEAIEKYFKVRPVMTALILLLIFSRVRKFSAKKRELSEGTH